MIPLPFLLLTLSLYPLLLLYASISRSLRFLSSSPLPYLKTPDPRDSIIFWFASPYLSPIFTSPYIPYCFRRWYYYARKDASWFHRGELPRSELGSDVFWTVQPGGLKLWVADPGVIGEITRRWKDFSKPVAQYGDLELFGRNVVTVEGKTWGLHRRITGPPFSEGNNHLVWKESTLQASYILSHFPPSTTIHDLHFITSTVALHVIASAGFNLHMPWPSSSQHQLEYSAPDASDPAKVGKAVYLVITCMTYLMIFPRWMLRVSPWRVMRDTQRAAGAWKRYIRGMIADARRSSGSGRSDLLSTLVKSSEGDDNNTAAKVNGGGEVGGEGSGGVTERRNLTDEEIVGNIYVFILAGHETTAGVLESAILHLAMDEELQGVIHREIDGIGDGAGYDDYKRMTMISCLMLETLRLYPPVIYLPKSTFTVTTPQTLSCRGKPFTVPPGVSITLDTVSAQRHPDYWGPDPHSFRISRWLTSDTVSTPPPATTNLVYPSRDHEGIKGIPKGSFFAFSEGARSCLGKKFAQVEFAAVIYTLLRNRRVELVLEEGEDVEGARRRCWRELDDRRTGVAVRMRGKVAVRFVER